MTLWLCGSESAVGQPIVRAWLVTGLHSKANQSLHHAAVPADAAAEHIDQQ